MFVALNAIEHENSEYLCLKKPKTSPRSTRIISPERVLVCILGQTRAHRLTWPYFKKHLLEELNADLALCIGVDDGYDYDNPFWRHAKYRWTVNELDDYGVGFDEARGALTAACETPSWRKLLGVKGEWLGGVKGQDAQLGSGGIQIYFRWLLLQNILHDRLLELYDRFLVTRSDFIWKIPHPPLSILSKNFIWIPNGEHWGGLTDRHIIVSARDLCDSLNLINDIVRRPELIFELMSQKQQYEIYRANQKPLRQPHWNIEKYILFHLRRSGLSDRVRLFPYVSYTVRDAGDQSRWQAGTYNSEVGMIVKYPTELDLARPFENLIKTKEDWETLARARPSLFSLGLS
jgi:hypothetical protein